MALLLALRRLPLLASGAAARTTARDVSGRHGNRRRVVRIPLAARPASHAAGRGGGGGDAGQNLQDSGQTLTEQIVQRYSVGLPPGKVVRSGDYVTLRPHRCMTHDNSWPVALKFMAMGASQIHDRRQIVMTLDHDVQNRTEANLAKYRRIEEFAARQAVDFYPAGRGIGHQIMVEEGYAWPGTLTVASDSHSNMYGGVGCLGTPVVRTDAASIWATGRTWWQVPPVARVRLSGTLPRGATGKDLIVALCGRHSRDEVLNHAVEFTGPEETMRSLPVDDRLTIANMTTEWGALTGLFPIDPTLQAWLQARAASNPSPTGRFSQDRLAALAENRLGPDPGARYAKTLSFDLSTLCPTVAGPNSVKIATPIDQLEAQHIRLNKAYLVSCTNSRASDIAAAARVFREAAAAAAATARVGSGGGGGGGGGGGSGNVAVVAPGVKFYIAAASSLEQRAAEEAGDWQILLAAGAQPLPAGCGPCIGLGTGLLEPGEVGISASNRNFKGRMGSTEAKAYLASPEIVAASALKGEISGPGWYQKGEQPRPQQPTAGAPLFSSPVDGVENGKYDASALAPFKEEAASAEDTLTEILPGFPAEIGGEIVFCDGDNINTDGIYPGKYTYQDDVTVDRMAEVCMENYDPAFGAIARPGDILAAGFNFGCGSSREQAATAILARRIPLVVAGSFGNIFSRNSINNALMGVEVPRLVHRLRDVFAQRSGAEEHKKAPLTRRTGWRLVWDVRRSRVVVTEGEGGPVWSERVGELPPNVQEIIARGGLEGWVKAQIGLNQSSTGEDGR